MINWPFRWQYFFVGFWISNFVMRVANETSSSVIVIILYPNFELISNIVKFLHNHRNIERFVFGSFEYNFGAFINAPHRHHHTWNTFWSDWYERFWLDSITYKIRLNIFFNLHSKSSQTDRLSCVLLKCSLSNNVKQLSNWNEIWIGSLNRWIFHLWRFN